MFIQAALLRLSGWKSAFPYAAISSRDKKKKVSSGSASAPSGQVGRFKNGMLILSSKEIQKIKGKRRGK